MKRINRRQFTKLAGGAALAVPLAPGLISGAAGVAPGGIYPDSVGSRAGVQAPPQQPAEAPKPEPKLKLTPEQQERVKQAGERRERQLAPLRNRELPYALEPAFVFRVQTKKTGGG